MPERYAAAYLRRSSADDANPGDVSREAQEAAVRSLAEREGAGELRLFVDWGKSADEAKESKRAAFLGMLRAIERDEISTVYAASLDRLYRSMRTFIHLTDSAKAHGVRIVTAREGVLGGDGSPMARAFAEITAVFSSLELNTIKARNAAAMTERKRRGDRFGVAPYGQQVVRDADGRAVKPIRWQDDPERSLAPLLSAYRAAGSVLGACRALDAAGIPTAHGQGHWHPSALTLILGREGVLQPIGKRVQVSRSSILSGLLRCADGTTLTPDRSKRGYYCRYAHWRRTDVHKSGPGFVREDAVLPAVRAEADRLRVPFDAVELGQEDDAAREGLAERKRRLALTFADGNLDEPTYRAEIAKVEAQVARVEAAAQVVELPALDWSAPPAAVNAVLRAIFEYVQLGPDMKVSKVEWRLPGWRA